MQIERRDTTRNQTPNRPFSVEHAGLIEFAMSLNLNVALTLTFNQANVPARTLERLAHRFIDRLGEKLNKRHNHKSGMTVGGIFFPEKECTNPHLHGAIWLPPKYVVSSAEIEKAMLTAEHIWNKLWPAGTVDLQIMTEPQGWLYYCTKEHFCSSTCNRFFLTEGFSRPCDAVTAADAA